MLIILSPAKKLDFSKNPPIKDFTFPYFTSEPQELIGGLQKYSTKELEELMGLSPTLAHLNKERYMKWEESIQLDDNTKQAIFSFNGDVYQGLDPHTLSKKELVFTQNHLRILSGLYGVLRPLDLIKPYRLEMGTKLNTEGYHDLYRFWREKITEHINDIIHKEGFKYIINLASQEYFKAIDKSDISVPIITPEFIDTKNGKEKMISFYAKKARGLMSRYIIKHAIKNPEELKLFDYNGYLFQDTDNSEQRPRFLRAENWKYTL